MTDRNPVISKHWPLYGLQLMTPRLKLVLPTEEELSELADVTAAGIQAPGQASFLVQWPSLPPAARARAMLQRHWQCQAGWSGDDWSLQLAVFADDHVVGLQELAARDYRILRQVSTFSWLGVRYQGQGLGTEMRAAVLHLAFAGLAATDAISSAFSDNASSLRVSEKLGYEHDGIERAASAGRATTSFRLRLSRARWQAHARNPVSITGLSPCLPLFGLGEDASP